MTVSEIIIRPMGAEEKPEVRDIAWRAFPLTEQLFFSWPEQTLVAEQEGRLLGAILLKTFALPGGRKGGLVAWVFTDPEARGVGAGQALVEGALEHFAAEGCDEIFACVEGYNSSSAKLFATREFSILSPGEQFRRYGWQFLPVWLRAVYFANVGHFLWVRPPEETSDSPALQWWGTWLFTLLCGWLAVWRRQGFSGFEEAAWLGLPAALLLLFGARTLVMRGVAAARGLRVRYRAWESTLPVTLIAALTVGGIFPAPGGLYPREHDWRYRELLPTLGRMALAATLVVLLLIWGTWGLREFVTLDARLHDWLGYVLFAGIPLAVLDTFFIFFPFNSYNGRRVWDWNRWLWGLLALATLAFFLV